MAKIKGFGKRKRIKIRISDDTWTALIQAIPIILILLIGLYLFGVISTNFPFSANVTGWP